jgi:hypothetical protein
MLAPNVAMVFNWFYICEQVYCFINLSSGVSAGLSVETCKFKVGNAPIFGHHLGRLLRAAQAELANRNCLKVYTVPKADLET